MNPITAPPNWRNIDLISDLHLQADPASGFAAWQQYMEAAPCDALFILGDLFEVWIGDDAVDADAQAGSESADTILPFERRCRDLLRRTAQRLPVHFMAGNRDFLIGEAFLDSTGVQGLQDPTLLHVGSRTYLLTHGDALCLDDRDYQSFRAEVRTAAWQQAFLDRALAERRAIARQMREQSRAHQNSRVVYAEVDADAARHLLREHQAETMIHGHTHRPAEHDLGQGLSRIVLSDWDAAANPPRAEVLRLNDRGWQRLSLSQALARPGN